MSGYILYSELQVTIGGILYLKDSEKKIKVTKNKHRCREFLKKENGIIQYFQSIFFVILRKKIFIH